jgi:ABC-2 type transport system permease protein
MMAEMLRVTARQLLGRRRTLIMVLLALVPIALALLFRLSGGEPASITGDRGFLRSVFDAFLVTLLLPLIALLFGTAAFGAEIEDGTVVYLLAKPIPRWRTVLAKLIVASAATIVLAGAATLLTLLIAVAGAAGWEGLLTGYLAGVAAGSVIYTTVFVALSLVTSRALIAGLAYVVIWEGVLANLLAGIRFLSIRQYALGIADAAGVDGRITPEALDAVPAIALGAIVTAFAALIAIRRLGRFEIPQED